MIKAVHVLHQACKVDSNVTEQVTTHTILESLGLVEQGESDLLLRSQQINPEAGCSSVMSRTSSSNHDLANSKHSSRLDTVSSISNADLPSPGLDEITSDQHTVSAETPSTTSFSSNSLPTPTLANDFLDPHHSMDSMFGIGFPEDMILSSCTMATDTSATVALYDTTTSTLFDDLAFYHDPFETKSPKQEQPTEELFGFDPSPPRTQDNSNEREKVEMIDDWPGFGRYAGLQRDFPPSSNVPVCASALSDVHCRTGSESSIMSTDVSSYMDSISLGTFDLKNASESSLEPLPPTRLVEHPMSESLDRLAFSGQPSTSGVQKRGRKRSGDSTRPQNLDGEKRRNNLEKNRCAAARHREKKRCEMRLLKQISHDTAAENNLLKQQTTQMQGELGKLRVKLLTHVSRGECRGPKEIKKSLDDGLV